MAAQWGVSYVAHRSQADGVGRSQAQPFLIFEKDQPQNLERSMCCSRITEEEVGDPHDNMPTIIATCYRSIRSRTPRYGTVILLARLRAPETLISAYLALLPSFPPKNRGAHQSSPV